MTRRVTALALLTVLTASAASAQDRGPPRRWFTGFGQGVLEATVRNNTGGELRFSCLAGSEAIKPSIALTIRTSAEAIEPAENLNAVFDVDGRPFEWAFQREQGADGEIVYDSEAFNDAAENSMAEIVESLRRGHALTIHVPDDRVRQTFTLAGSSAALEGCPRG